MFDGNKLKRIMHEKNINSKGLAELIEVSPTYISYLLNNKRKNPSMDLLNNIAKKLNISLSELIDDENTYASTVMSKFRTLPYEDVTLDSKIYYALEKLLEYVYSDSADDILVSDKELEKFKEIIKKELPKNEALYNTLIMSYKYKPLSNMFKSDIAKVTLQKDNKGISNVDLSEATPVTANDVVNIPIVGTVRAGQPLLAIENIEGYFPAPKANLSINKEYFYLRVKGDSMNLKFSEGSLLLVEKCESIENGEIGVILIDGLDATVKKVVMNDNMITLIPMSNNPEHMPMMYDVVKDQVNIIGKAKMAINFL